MSEWGGGGVGGERKGPGKMGGKRAEMPALMYLFGIAGVSSMGNHSMAY